MKLTHLGLVGLATLIGCVAEERRVEETGQVEMSLTGASASGSVYRLRDAVVMVQGPANTLFFQTEEQPNRTTLSADVPAGSYFTFLQEGWRLERLRRDNVVEPVEAQLLSPNPLNFDVFPDERTQVALRFRVDAEDVELRQGAFDVVLEVEETDPTTEGGLCSSDSDCGEGETCCVSGFLGMCTQLEPGGECPLPDLTISAETAQGSLFISHEVFPADSCAIVEGCVAAAGDRRLLNFSTETPNIGGADMILGDPNLTSGFEFSACHNHYHFEGYARYELLDANGAIAATGHKQAFCLMDLSSVGVPGAPSSPRYHCGFQGIQRGWSDIYGAGLDCQWVDITGVAAGEYTLRLSVNTNRTLPESNYDNNTIEVPVTIPEDVPPGPAAPLEPCGFGGQGPERDCGWSIAPGFEAATCTPGEPLVVGCGCSGGVCAGDPMIRICDGAAASGCTEAEAVTSVDDACNVCPEARIVCPESGVYTVLIGAWDGFSPFTCEVAAAAP
ncbi:lysyl oxidase family protein [Sorangium sp. So ce131]|uniref:lysyl oxidase family protein n=1 Tax=Sorangium sp. So ce131 TaxID=3133282 RepID=UPI003F60AFED